VYGPPGVESVTAGFEAAFALDSSYRTAHHGAEWMPPAGGRMTARVVQVAGPDDVVTVFERGELRVRAFAVDHSPVHPAYGYRVDYRGRSVIFSGDTIQQDILARVGQGADVMVHEALAPHMMLAVADQLERAGDRQRAQLVRDTLSYHATPVQAAETANAAGGPPAGLQPRRPVAAQPRGGARVPARGAGGAGRRARLGLRWPAPRAPGGLDGHPAARARLRTCSCTARAGYTPPAMRQDLLARLKLPPRRFRRLVLFAMLVPTIGFSWGVRTQGCNVDTPVALLPPIRTLSFADADMAWLLALALVWLVAPIGIERVASVGKRALLNLASALVGGFLAFVALFAAIFTETIFGRLLAVSIAGGIGMTCIGALVVEAWSWVVTDVVAALRRRRASVEGQPSAPGAASEVVVADGVAGEEGGLPGDRDAVEDEAGRV
jgi:hypothetical protein